MPERPHRSSRRSVAAVLACILMLATVAAIGATPAEARAIVSARARYGVAIEPLAAYQPQTTCSPVAKPGVVDLSKRLLRAFPTTRSLGIVRACSVGGVSEHKEGRAFDWGGLNAHSAADRARVARFVTWLTTTDAYGNRYAMTRRLGIQYLIWNHKIWGSYLAGAGWRKYSGADPHTNHVHISFTWAGARKATSFWTGKVADGTAPTPTPTPTATHPVPTPTPTTPPTGDTTPPRPEPVPAATLPQGPELVDETVRLPGTSAGTLTAGALAAGQPYLIEASGTWQWGKNAGKVADAECSTTPDDPTWRRDRSVHTMQPGSDHLDLYVDGNDMVGDPDTDTGGSCDTVNHTYRWTYTPTRTGRVAFASWDPTTLADNSGGLTIRVIRSTPVDQVTWSVPATAAAGVTSPGALTAGESYVVTVTGTIDAGGGVQSDARCSTTPTDPTWHLHPTADPAHPGAAALDVLVDRKATQLAAVTSTDGSMCDSTDHAYRSVVKATSTRPINLRVDDPTPGDDTGALTVTVTHVVQPTTHEDVALDTRLPAGARTAQTYLAGRLVHLTATGTYTLAPGSPADAACRSGTGTAPWVTTTPGIDGGVTVGGKHVDWLTAGSRTCDTATHSYTLAYTPSVTGPLSFAVADTAFADNTGIVSITVTPGG